MSITEREAYQTFIQQITGSKRVVRYCPALAESVGGVKAALLLSQLIYWSSDPAARRRGGWILKTVEELRLETGLTKAEQHTAREELAHRGVIEIRLKGIPRIWHYRVIPHRLAELYGLAGETADSTIRDEGAARESAARKAGGEDDAIEDGAAGDRASGAQPPSAVEGGCIEAASTRDVCIAAAPIQPEPHLTPSSMDETPADVGQDRAPILGAEDAQLNKELKITTQITEERECAKRSLSSARRPQACASSSEPAAGGQPCADALPLLPAEGSFQESGKESKTPPPPDSHHPAVGMVREVTGRYPAKVVFDLVIAALGEQPDRARFASVHQAWCARGYNPVNLEGQLEWYAGGIPAVNRPDAGRWGTGQNAAAQKSAPAHTYAEIEAAQAPWREAEAKRKAGDPTAGPVGRPGRFIHQESSRSAISESEAAARASEAAARIKRMTQGLPVGKRSSENQPTQPKEICNAVV